MMIAFAIPVNLITAFITLLGFSRLLAIGSYGEYIFTIQRSLH
jgi:hypothetical protein